MTQASKALKPSATTTASTTAHDSAAPSGRKTAGVSKKGRAAVSKRTDAPATKRTDAPATKRTDASTTKPTRAPVRPAEPASKKTPKRVDVAVKAIAPTGGRRIQVRRSGVHGKGMFAVARIPKGETIIEYKGELIDWPEALRRHPHDPTQPNHTFYFSVGDTHVIDGNVDGNASRWINHSCEPNCEADETEDGRVFIKSLRVLKPGEELFFDYGLVIDERHTARLKKDYECRCGAASCRHTMLAPKR